MKALLLSILLLTSSAASAQTNSALAGILSTNRVWTSIAVNHKQIVAEQYLGCWFVLCKPVSSKLSDNMTVYYDPSIELTPTNSVRSIDVSAFIKKGTNTTILAVQKFGNKEYKWQKLEPAALAQAVEVLKKENRWRR